MERASLREGNAMLRAVEEGSIEAADAELVEPSEGERLPLRQTIPIRPRKILKYSILKVMKSLLQAGALLAVVLWVIKADLFFTASPALFHKVLLCGFFLLLGVAVLRMAREVLHFFFYFYDIEGNNIVIRKGIISKKEVILSFSRITDVYVDQDLGDFVFRLYDIHLSTPTSESMKFAHINGLNKRGAVKMRKMILRHMNAANATPQVEEAA